MVVAVLAFARKKSHADPSIARDQLLALQRMERVWGREKFCAQFAWILKKKPDPEDIQPKGVWNKRLVPFQMNAIQLDLHEKRSRRNIILKPRQVGQTTDHIINRLLIPTILDPGSAGLLVSQTKAYGAQHFVILHRCHKLFGKVNVVDDTDPANELWRQLHEHLLHTQYSHRTELVFDMIDSRILCDTAENTEVGQGLPGISYLVATEVARWPHIPEETMANVKESVHQDGTVDIESTANGMGGYFHEEWNRATTEANAEFTPHFYPWWWDKKYRMTLEAIGMRNEKEFWESMSKEKREEAQELQRLFKLDLEQMIWRRKKQISLRKEFKEKYPESAATAFLTSGQKFFDEEAIAMRLLQVKNLEPKATSEDGTLVIYKRRNVKRQYLLAADPATGRMVNSTDTDFCAFVVIDIETGEEMAAYQERLPPEEFAIVIRDVAEMYNNALVAVERTGDGTTVMLQLSHLNYNNIYEHIEYNKKEQKLYKVKGWPPTTITRPIACNKLAEYIRDHIELFYDSTFLNEALTFVRNKNGKPEAAPGNHDDTVSARYIAHYCRLVVLGFLDPTSGKGEGYGNADAA